MFCFERRATGLLSPSSHDAALIFARGTAASPTLAVTSWVQLRLLEVAPNGSVQESGALELASQLLRWDDGARLQAFDWTGDGRLELLLTHGSPDPTLSVYAANDAAPGPAFEPLETVTLGDWRHGGPYPLRTTADGPVTDLLVSFGGGVEVHRRGEDGAFAPVGPRLSVINVCRDTWFIEQADIDDDGDLDALLFGTNEACGKGMRTEERINVTILRRDDDTFEDPLPTVPTGFLVTRMIGYADIDADGVKDIIAAGTSQPLWLRGLPGGAFEAGEALPTPEGATLADVADFDGDGDADGLYQTRGGVSFSDSVLAPAPLPFQSQDELGLNLLRRSGDLNGDGIPDVALSTPVFDAEGSVAYGLDVLLSNP